jgi:hypothetical protein
MTQAVVHILSEVERLSRSEQADLRRRICERVPMSEDLTDEDTQGKEEGRRQKTKAADGRLVEGLLSFSRSDGGSGLFPFDNLRWT